MRVRSCSFVFVVLSFSTAAAQSTTKSPKWTLTTQAGFHFDRIGRPERIHFDDNGNFRYSGQGEAAAVGLRATYWTHRFMGFDVGITAAQNRSWYGSSDAYSPDVAKQTFFASASLVLRSGSLDRRMQAQLRFGPAAIFHTGSGESTLSRPVDFGLTAALGSYVRVGQRLQLGMELQNYTFQSHYLTTQFSPNGHVFGEDHRTRNELVLLPTVRYWFR